MVTIDFSKVRPNGIGLERYSRWQSSTFRAVYERAEQCLREIVQAGSEAEEPDAGALFQIRISDQQNRVMAFVGDRGTGKTSAMISFVNACVDGSVTVPDRAGRPYSFYSLPVIEPSRFSGWESIIGYVVSQIYSELEEHYKLLDRTLVHTIINQCTCIREAIRVWGMSPQALLEQNSDELSHLRFLSQTKRLQEQLQQLIDSYLTMRTIQREQCSPCGQGNLESSFLIIPIDDIDTSIHAAYRLAEELRSYFMLPHVIVVMALKVEQLSDALEQRFIHEFKDLYAAGSYLDAQPATMAAKYIQKLIPEQHQIQMPGLSLTELGSCMLRTEKGESRHLVNHLLELIHSKTGILLIPDERNSHPLIPHNLRALHQMLCLFDGMKDTADLRGESGQQQYLDQLEGAQKWLLDHVAASRLPMRLSRIIGEFAAHPDQGVNAFLWRALARSVQNEVEQDAAALLSRHVRNENISTGDVLYLLSVLEETSVDCDFALFGAAVRMLYSIRLQRRMVQSLSITTQEQSVDEAFPNMPDEGYLGVQQILNGLIYDPVLRLTYDGFERMYNGDAVYGKVALPAESANNQDGAAAAGKLYSLYGGIQLQNKPGESDGGAMSPEEAVWSSMFIVGFGRVRHRDIHTLESSILTGILPPGARQGVDADILQNGDTPFLSCNWMAFAHNLLVPRRTAARLLWQIEAQVAQKKDSHAEDGENVFEKTVEELDGIRFPVLFDCLRLDSADFLHYLIRHMAAHTEEICQNRTDHLATFHGFSDFKAGLEDSISTVRARSCLSEEGKGLEELKKFLTVPSKSGTDYKQYDWMGGQ